MNLELVENLVALIGEYPLSDVEVTQDGRRICVRRSPLAAVPAPAAVEAAPFPTFDNALSGTAPNAPASDGVTLSEGVTLSQQTLTAPMVGIFYHAEPPLPYAADLRPGQVVGHIESMKLRNDVLAEEGGRITDVLVEDGAPVEYGQALFRFITLAV